MMALGAADRRERERGQQHDQQQAGEDTAHHGDGLLGWGHGRAHGLSSAVAQSKAKRPAKPAKAPAKAPAKQPAQTPAPAPAKGSGDDTEIEINPDEVRNT